MSQTQWDYDFQPVFYGGSPMTAKREYDFGAGSPGPLLRQTKYDWLQMDYPSEYTQPFAVSNPSATHWIMDRKTEEIVLDGSGNVVADTINVYNNGSDPGAQPLVTAVKKWNNLTNSYLVTGFQYGSGGVVTSVTDPNGNVTGYSYTDNFANGPSNSNTGAYPTQITYQATNGAAHVEKKQYYYGSGLVAASCGENYSGNCTVGKGSAIDYTSYAYDVMGRATSTVTGDGGSTTVCYSEISNGRCYSAGYPLTVVSTEAIATGVSKTTTAILDGLARVTQTQLNSDPNCSTGTKVDTTYDQDERVSTKSNPYCGTSNASLLTTTTYDGLSRVLRVTNPDGSYVTNSYTGRSVTTADEGNGPAGASVDVERISQKDGLGRLTAVCEVSATTQQGSSSNTPSSCALDAPGTGFLTNYTYDTLDNLHTVAQGGVNRAFIYDSLSRLQTATNPESGTTHYTYYPNGNLYTKTSANGIITTYTYDGLNRLTGKSYSDNSTPSACFQYDQSTSTNGVGRLTTEWTQAGTCSSTLPASGVLTQRTFAAYDLMGRVATDQQCSTPGNCTGTSLSVSYGYDLAGNMNAFSNGLSGQYAMPFSSVYDSAGRLSAISGPSSPGSNTPTTLFQATAYTPASAIADAQLGSGIALHRDYDSRLRPVDEYDSVKTTPGTASVQITGAEQESGYSTGSITFGGSEQSVSVNGQTQYDGGNFVISIANGSAIQIQYGACDTPATLASKLAGHISCSTGPVQAAATGATVFLLSCNPGSTTEYPISATFDGNSSLFPQPSFSVMTSSSKLATAPPSGDSPGETLGVVTFTGAEQTYTQGGQLTYDSGAFTIPFYNATSTSGNNLAGVATVPWQQGDTPQSLAATLVSKLQPCSAGGFVNAVQNGAVVYLTSCTPGISYVENVVLNHGGPSTASFSADVDGYLVSGVGKYDFGTVALSINNTQVASTTYSSASTPASIVAALVKSGSSNNLVNLAASTTDPSFLTITAQGGQTDQGYSYALNFTYDTTDFTQPSFASPSASGQLQGGQDAPLYSWQINSYAPDSNVLSVTDSVMGSWTYGYDDMNRLITGSATAGSMSGLNLGWQYDRYGNRWNQTPTGSSSASAVVPSFTFTGNNNRIDGLSYDADGNLLSDGQHAYTYDAENRIVTINGQPTYIYDAEGTRVAKLGSGGALSAIYILGTGGQQITELSGTGLWQHSNVYAAGGRLVTTYEGPGEGSSGYHYNLTDWLGTKRLQTLTLRQSRRDLRQLPIRRWSQLHRRARRDRAALYRKGSGC